MSLEDTYINSNGFGDHLTSPLVPSAGQGFHLCYDIS